MHDHHFHVFGSFDGRRLREGGGSREKEERNSSLKT
jgi:hypothetical protein